MLPLKLSNESGRFVDLLQVLFVVPKVIPMDDGVLFPTKYVLV